MLCVDHIIDAAMLKNNCFVPQVFWRCHLGSRSGYGQVVQNFFTQSRDLHVWFFIYSKSNTWHVLLTKSDVKVAGCWSICFCLFMDRDGIKVHNWQKKQWIQYPAILTEQAWTIKDLLNGKRTPFFWGRQRVIPSEQDSAILPARVANYSAAFCLSCPFTELAAC